MSTIFDANDSATPQTHVLVIGVNDYAHLPGVPTPGQPVPPPRLSPANYDFGLHALTAAVPSAAAVAEWFLLKHNNPDAPLGSVTLLLSPTTYSPSNAAADKIGAAHGASLTVGDATLNSIVQAAQDWFLRGNAHRDNALVLYFCGHGLEATDRFLVPADYGVDPWNSFSHLINLNATHYNLNKCQAKTQCFFIDACRETPDLLRQAPPGTVGKPLIGTLPGSSFDRDAPIYHGAVSGQKASALIGGVGFFTTGLLECLNGMGAGAPVGGGRWSVDTDSLGTALKSILFRRGQTVDVFRHPLERGLPDPSEVHFASDPVPVLATLRCRPNEAHDVAELWLTDSSGTAHARVRPFGSDPWEPIVLSGDCTIEARFDAGAAWRNATWTEQAIPPLFRPRIQVRQ